MLMEVHVGPSAAASERAGRTLNKIPLGLHYSAYNPHSMSYVEAWETAFVRPL
jgi:hypothetical protein